MYIDFFRFAIPIQAMISLSPTNPLLFTMRNQIQTKLVSLAMYIIIIYYIYIYVFVYATAGELSSPTIVLDLLQLTSTELVLLCLVLQVLSWYSYARYSVNF